MTGASREHHGERHAGSLAASAGDLVALPRRPAVGSDVYLVGGKEAVHGGGESCPSQTVRLAEHGRRVIVFSCYVRRLIESVDAGRHEHDVAEGIDA